MSAIVVLVLVSSGCLVYCGYRLALEVAFQRRALRATGQISRLTADTRGVHEDPVVQYPVEIATVAVLVAPRRTVDRTLPHSPVDPGRFRVGDTVSLRLDPHGRREPVLDGADPDLLLRWGCSALLFAAATAALLWLLVELSGGVAA